MNHYYGNQSMAATDDAVGYEARLDRATARILEIDEKVSDLREERSTQEKEVQQMHEALLNKCGKAASLLPKQVDPAPQSFAGA